MLRKKLINKTTLTRMATLEGWKGGWEVFDCEEVGWPPLGRSVLYISMINEATMEENKLFYG